MTGKMSPQLQIALSKAGYGDLDPVTGPKNNPNYVNEWYYVTKFLEAAEAYNNPVFPEAEPT